MKMAIIVPNWNGEDFLEDCLKSLANQTVEAQIVVVDNGSTDESLNILKRHPSVHVIRHSRNLGFTGGVNPGICYALEKGAEYIALFNNDAVAEQNWLEKLVKTMRENKNTGIVTGKFLETDKSTLDSTGEEYSIWGTLFSRGRGEKDTGQYDSPSQRLVFAASGGASLYRAELFKDIGIFDESFFAYYEDVDISFRAQLAGWTVMYEPKAIAYHRVSATSEKLGDFRLYHMYKNFAYLFIKNMPGPLFWRYGWRVLGVFAFKKLQLIVRFKFVTLFRVAGSVLWHLPEMLRKRRHIQKHKKVDNKYIDSLLHHAPPPTQPGLTRLIRKLHIK